MNNNYPDDCQGRGQHLPWNEVEPTHECCDECSETVEVEEMYDHDGELYCKECFGEQFQLDAEADNRTDNEEYKEVE